MKALQVWEDKTQVDKLDIEFQQRVIAASRGPKDEELYFRLWSDEGIDPTDDFVPGIGRIEQPTSVEEFENMFAQWAEEDGMDLEEFAQLFDSSPGVLESPDTPQEPERNPGNQPGRVERYI